MSAHRSLASALAALLLALTASASQAESPVKLCQDSLGEDKQPPFQSSSFVETSSVAIRGDKSLQVDTNLTRLDSERIYFPFDQHVTISYVYESAGASHVLGYLYYEDMVARGYIDTKGTPDSGDDVLKDTNANGILDLHEDLYNLAPRSGSQARPYVGTSPRCDKAFSSRGFNYSEPELAMNSSCSSTFQRSSDPSAPDKVGRKGNQDRPGLTDGGLFPTIPNLLEPAHARNGLKGAGKLVFLLADDDGDTGVHFGLGPVTDGSNKADGVPDYDVSAYDSTGQLRAVNPDPGITEKDRTVDLGIIPGGKELVFFIVAYYDASPLCLRMEGNECTLELESPINVYFSKTAWNMDLNRQDNAEQVVAARNIGCGYAESCNKDNPDGSGNSCTVAGTTTKLCGWLDSATLDRLSTPAYNNLHMPLERVAVMRPAQAPKRMPHVLVGAPSTDPFRWILGFEDLPTGGDRDFNDVVFAINKQNGGMARSTVVTSGEISAAQANDFTITKVRFARFDDMAPSASRACSSPPCWTEAPGRPGACTSGATPPDIRYSLAVDCRVCTSGVCVENATPNWQRIEFKQTRPPTHEMELDLLAMGLVGSQLCWKVEIISPSDYCQPVVNDVNVGYQAVRGGLYARTAPSLLGNAAVWGASEMASSSWGRAQGQPGPSARALDNRLDFSPRGRLFFKTMYDPENPNLTRVTERWEVGTRLIERLRSSGSTSRKLYSLDPNGTYNRLEVSAALADERADSPLFPDSRCDEVSGGRPVYDLNGDGLCGTPSHPEKSLTGDYNDRRFLRDWLYGWEDRYDPLPSNPKGGNQLRAWHLGAIHLSTVAVAPPPYPDMWFQSAPPAERDAFQVNFLSQLKTRPTVAYVGTMQGYLHALDLGHFRNETQDGCVSGKQYRGLFKPKACGTQGRPAEREYGTGQELFAYLPRGLLGSYVEAYVRKPNMLQRPQIDASPTLAQVDLGLPGKPAWTIAPTAQPAAGAKTVLVSASGKDNPLVFALDVTQPDKPWYPLPMWEYKLQDAERDLSFSQAMADALARGRPTPAMPDGSGSRHAASVGRLLWGSERKWAAVVPTDYVPSSGRAGALFLLDMKTGRPLTFSTGGQEHPYTGVITLDPGFGVAAEASLVDINQDGTVDVLYVPSTSGNVWRINLSDIDHSRPLGQQVSRCVVARAPADLTRHPQAAQGQDQKYQQIHSNLAVRVVQKGSGRVVRFFFGTGDSPEDVLDGPPSSKTLYRYHLLAYEDADPLGRGGCQPLSPLWVVPLDPGQAVWGGVSLSEEQVYATSAVGRAADVCNLSQQTSGRFYTATQLPSADGMPEVTSSQLNGHGLNTPVVHDQHLFIQTADGRMRVMGGNEWNNEAGTPSQRRSRVLVWEPVPDGALPK